MATSDTTTLELLSNITTFEKVERQETGRLRGNSPSPKRVQTGGNGGDDGGDSGKDLVVPLETRRDAWLMSGLLLGALAVIAGIAVSGAGLGYFFQPGSALIVLGGTFSITMVTSPKQSLLDTCRRVWELRKTPVLTREALIEEVVEFARVARRGGTFSIEPLIPRARSEDLRNGLLTSLDVKDMSELQVILETELKLVERHGQADAVALELAAGYAPVVGIIGTVVGLIEVLRHFTDLKMIGPGIGAAFVSTIYGLGAANFFLLPLAHRIHTRISEECETRELIAEGVLGIYTMMHPGVVRQRLAPYLKDAAARERVLNFKKRVEVITPHATLS